MTRDEIRVKLIAVVDRALEITKQGESVYAVLAKLIVEDVVYSAPIDKERAL